jgi:hypothetical protein
MPRPEPATPAPILALLLACIITLSAGVPADAETTATSIDSEPQGADVFVLKGFRRERLGTTPLLAELSFRSPQSILRLEFVKAGYASETVEVTAADDPTVVRLSTIPAFAPANAYDDPGLRALQRDLPRELSDAWSPMLAAIEPWRQTEPAMLAREGNRIVLHVPLQTMRQPGSGPVSADEARELGERFARQISPYFASAARVELAVLSLRLPPHSGGVVSSTGSRTVTEMACEGGMVTRSVWDSCATRSTVSSGGYTTSKCVPGSVTRQTFDPCAMRVARQRQEVAIKAVPKPAVAADATRVIVTAAAEGRVLGICRYTAGRRVETYGPSADALFEAGCPSSLTMGSRQ